MSVLEPQFGPDPAANDEIDALGADLTASGQSAQPAAPPESGLPVFTASEKVRSLAAMLEQRARQERRAGTALRLARLTGLLEILVGQLPAWDRPEEWDQLLMMFVGVALQLTSDGVEPDIPAAKDAGAQVLAALFANIGP